MSYIYTIPLCIDLYKERASVGTGILVTVICPCGSLEKLRYHTIFLQSSLKVPDESIVLRFNKLPADMHTPLNTVNLGRMKIQTMQPLTACCHYNVAHKVSFQ